MIKIAFIVNGSRKLTKENQGLIELCCNRTDLLVEKRITSYSGHAIKLAIELAESKINLIVAVGGDGTANEVLNGIMSFEIQDRPIFYVLANGTANDFIRGEIQYFKTNNFYNALYKLEKMPIDIGALNSSQNTIFFLNIADAGIGGKVVEILDEQRKYFGGKLSYYVAILRGFITYKKPDVRIKINELEISGSMLMIAVCNGKMFGDGLKIAPDAKIDDGFFNVSLFLKVSIWDYLRNLSRLKAGIKLNHQEVFYYKCQKLEIKVNRGELYTEADGELFKKGDVSFEIIPKAISLLKI